MKRILIVDDEAPILALLDELLTLEGYEVDTAETAAEALGLVREELYDVAILDFALPDMNGVMLHSQIRQIDRDLAERTLFISGEAQSETDMSYYTSSAAGFISKPFDVQELVATVERLLA